MTSCACEPADLTCQTEARRADVRRSDFNGLDYLEVSDDQTMLTVYFLGPAPQGIGIDNVAITGGARIRDLRVVDVRLCPQSDPERDNCLVVTVDRPGDFSTYSLCLVNLPEDARFDPRYRCLCFSFKAACPSDLDCKSVPDCPPDRHSLPEIDYLAKDYASFRQLILDRLAVVMPDWRERHVPDLGVTLVELLAYVGDHLSYYQDAVATEAYLGTARQRISVRRHARLVDYFLHEGCNARTWVAVETSADVTFAAHELSFLTAAPEVPQATGRLLNWADLAAVPADRYEVFEPLSGSDKKELIFLQANNRIRLYTWGNSLCCLPRGATSATLVDGTPPEPVDLSAAGDPDEPHNDCDPPHPGGQAPTPGQRALSLAPGDVLIFVEVIGPRTGVPADADPAHRHPVRVTHVAPATDSLTGQPLLEIAWADADALPFPLCLSVIGPPPGCALIEDVSIALGNVVLADHGRRRRAPQDLGCVPADHEEIRCLRAGRPTDPVRHPGKFNHAEIEGPLTFCAPVDPASPAATVIAQDPRAALPALQLQSWRDAEGAAVAPAATVVPADLLHWVPQRDLLDSGPEDTHVVVEIDDRRQAHLRFGDDRLGRRPDAGARFEARYRTGNGPAGNVGADKLTVTVVDTPVSGLTLTPRNPLAAQGGTAPEAVADARLFAPYAFGRILERAVTPADYAEIAARHPGVQRAAASLRWNGSWYQVRVAIDPLGRTDPTPELLAEIATYLHRFRRIGHDLAVVPARYVPLDIVMQICVAPSHLRGHVKAALIQRFGNGRGPDGLPAFFHPDALSFGQSIALSRLVAAAQTVEGVQSASVIGLQRLFEGPNGEIEAGVLPIGAHEVARLDSDPNFPEYGRIRFNMRGGR